MSINEAVRIVRERGRIVLLCLLLGLLGAGAAVTLAPRQYAADVSLYVSAVGRADSSDDAYKASQLAKDRVTSYAPLMRDKRVTQAVVDKLQLPMTADQLANHLTVTVAPDSVVMVARVTDSSPDQAAAIANAVAAEFVGLVTQLEQPFGPPPPSTPTPAPTVRGQPATPPAAQPPVQQSQIRPEVIRQAVPSSIPVSPNVPFGLALGGSLGLLIGLGAAFLSNARDHSIRDPDRLHALTSAGVLAEIPEDRAAKTLPLAQDKAPEPPSAEAFRRLRTNLQFHHAAPRGTGAKVVVVTSASVGDGTSVTACNLARALAASSRVMLIDANLRHPQVETYLGLEPGPGLTTVLSGNLTWPFARRKHHDLPLDVLSSGPVAPRLGELLTWRRMDDLLHELRRRYDFVIIDAPALLPVSDASAVAARADGVLLVVRYGSTTEEQVSAAVAALRAVSAPLVGTVLNMVPPQKLRRMRSRMYAQPQSSPNLPLMLSPVNPLVPSDRRIPADPVTGPPRKVPPDQRGPIESVSGSPRALPADRRGTPEPGAAERRPPVEPAAAVARNAPADRGGPTEPANGPSRKGATDRRRPAEPANVSGRNNSGSAESAPDSPKQ